MDLPVCEMARSTSGDFKCSVTSISSTEEFTGSTCIILIDLPTGPVRLVLRSKQLVIIILFLMYVGIPILLWARLYGMENSDFSFLMSSAPAHTISVVWS